MLSFTAITAANRFGYGLRPQDVETIVADPQDWLKRQIPAQRRAALPPSLANRPTSAQLIAPFLAARHKKAAGQVELEALRRNYLRPEIEAEMAALIQAQIDSETPFVERWVQFWANHFTVSGRNPVLLAMAGGYEREAIRPHVFGRFSDLLLSATQHPAMQVYLDNAKSIGPDSRAGQRRKVGLNENHAREILELHTVSPASGYSQADVIALAKMLTGWSVGIDPDDHLCGPGQFCFRPNLHEPGKQVLLGHSFAQDGSAQGEAALQMLASHPATARHIGEKLARHFIADDPPPAAVAALAKTFRETDGDLLQMAQAVIARPEAWSPECRKLRTPRDFLIAAARLTETELPPRRLIGLLRQFGEPPFQAPSPAGWPDEAKDWMAPGALRQRIELAYILGHRAKPAAAPVALLDVALGEMAGAETRTAVARAESRQVALATILAAPEFQWR